jgi:hypothetical protein
MVTISVKQQFFDFKAFEPFFFVVPISISQCHQAHLTGSKQVVWALLLHFT